MKRYFFDLRDGDELTPDDEGVELSTMEAVQDRGRAFAGRHGEGRVLEAPQWSGTPDGYRSQGRHRTGVTSQIHVPDRTAQALRRPL